MLGAGLSEGNLYLQDVHPAAERLSILSAHSRISVAVAFSGSLLRPLALSLAAPAGHRHHCGYSSRGEDDIVLLCCTIW